MTTNFFSIGFFGLTALVVIAVVVAVIVFAARDRTVRRVLIVVVSLAALLVVVASFIALTVPLATRSAATATTQQASDERTAIVEAQAGRGDETTTTQSVRIVEGLTVVPGKSVNVWARRAMMLAALAVMISLAYVFVDAGRRGRYTWPLRIGSAAAFAMLCLLLARLGPLM